MLKISSGTKMPEHLVIPSPSYGINHTLGGGFWTGRFHLLWGNFSVGKTTFCLHTMARAQEMGYTPVIIDAERSYTDEWAEKCGIDLSNREVLQSNVLEPILKEIVPMMKDSKKKYAILVDSLNGIASESFFKDAEGGGGMAYASRARVKMMMKMSEYMHPSNNVVFMVAQQTTDLSGNYPRLMAKIGKAEEHWVTNIIRLFGSRDTKNIIRDENTQMIQSKTVRWDMEKCKQAPVEGTRGEYFLIPQTAVIDQQSEILDLAVLNGIITRAAAWYYFEDLKWNGINAVKNNITPDTLERVAKLLSEKEEWVLNEELQQDGEG
jgi:recombination protein RecA